MKAKIVNSYLASFSQEVNNCLFIHLKREPLYVIRSLIKARKDWTGDAFGWFSWKPREFQLLNKMDIYHQCAGQVYFVEKEIHTKKKFMENRYLPINYENFCNYPERYYDFIVEKVKEIAPHYPIQSYNGPSSFNVSKIGPNLDDEKILDAYDFFVDRFGVIE